MVKKFSEKIIFTGGAGFIGSHIVDKYIDLGYKVVVIDNFSTGFKKNLNKRAKFYKADIRNLPLLEKIFKKEKPQIINHYAAVAEVIKSLKDPTLTYQVNILGTANVLLAGAKVGIKKFIFISSGGTVYGRQKKPLATEKSPVDPLSPYPISKLAGEKLVKFYARNHNFNYLILRCGNVYGPRQNPKGEAGVVAIFSGLMKKGIRPTIFGDGGKTRDYVYVGDIVEANVLGLKKGKNEILNLGSGKETADQKVFDTLARELKFKKPPIYAPFRKGEVNRIALNCSRARKILKWQPKISFQEGVKKYLNNL
ncbi:MAG: NAD-dependent epimerase/dehydratase family protein [bacterium]|nr:NAD-dependent epimerase/dehydratase family protein [bacterium]